MRAGVKDRSKRAAEREFGKFLARIHEENKISDEQLSESRSKLASGRQVNPLI